MEKMMERELLTWKVGRTSVTDESGIAEAKLDDIVDQLAALHADYDLQGVSSGSIALGRAEWAQAGRTDFISDQSAAMLGSAPLVTAYKTSFARHGILAGQLLVTHHEIEDLEEQGMLKRSLEEHRRLRIVSVGNENDALSTIEVKEEHYEGENDGLANHIADLMGAEILLLLTDCRGLLDSNGDLVREVGTSKTEVRKNRAHIEDNGKGERQGMFSKFDIGVRRARLGKRTIIGEAMADYFELIDGLDGTHF